MSTSSSPSIPSPLRVATALYRSLEAQLTQQCAREYDAGVVVQCITEPTKENPELRFWIDCPKLTQVPVRCTVIHVGGPLYEVDCAIEGGSSQRFSESVPAQPQTEPVRIPALGKNIATFFRHELEK